MQAKLYSPAGDWECARAAVAAGADGVYFGLPRFNARMRAKNFREEDLPALCEYLRNHGVEAVAALNVLIFPDEIEAIEAEVDCAVQAGVDAIIVQDVGLAHLIHRRYPHLRLNVSTQMSITSPEGVAFARKLGCSQIVLARELSLDALAQFDTTVPLEAFVHGALCVAYSGQCLTSEALGQRSANRGECAQACRLPYTLIVDGQPQNLGAQKYLLSPRDLAAIEEIPAMLEVGVTVFKIEGRLKSPEYVAATTSLYRKALDAAIAASGKWKVESGKLETRAEGAEKNFPLSTFHFPLSEADRYQLEMTFSRGLGTGWLHGTDHTRLINAEYAKKRGILVGTVAAVSGMESPAVRIHAHPSAFPLKRGDGLVFEDPASPDHEQGGRIYEIVKNELHFAHGALDPSRLRIGMRVFKTDDPALDTHLKKLARARPQPRNKRPLDITLNGRLGEKLTASANGVTVQSDTPLVASEKHSLDEETFRAIFSKLGETPYRLGALKLDIAPGLFMPRSAITDLRQQLTEKLTRSLLAKDKSFDSSDSPDSLDFATQTTELLKSLPAKPSSDTPQLTVLVRTPEQLTAALEAQVPRIYAELRPSGKWKVESGKLETAAEGGEQLSTFNFPLSTSEIFLATPRIQKPGEQAIFAAIANANPDGILVRNFGGLAYFRDRRMVGDYSLNVANPATAAIFLNEGLERLTISYDLDATQVLSLLEKFPPQFLELTLHQHVPMFHIDHCPLAAHMTHAPTRRDCGRLCERHRAHLRDRVSVQHPLRSDIACRTTVYNGRVQSGAQHLAAFLAAGLRNFRIEFLEETADQTRETIALYRALLDGTLDAETLVSRLKAASQLGITRGTLA